MSRYQNLSCLCGIVLVLLCAGLWQGTAARLAQAQAVQEAAAQTEVPFNQAQTLAALRMQLAGKEKLPAEQVFKNIQTFKGLPAENLLRVMEFGYSRSLGVTCTHCHVAGQWEKEEKPTKQITREMAALVSTINSEHLKKIKNLKSANPIINCTTCHRGQIKPALNLP
jgi:hypothetical protein